MTEAIRSLAASEVPGGANSPTVNVPSLNSGRNELPKVEPSHTESAAAAAATPSTRARQRRAKRTIGSYDRLRPRTRNPSRASRSVGLPSSRMRQSAGVTVKATTNDPISETTKAIPRGRKKRPSIPPRNIRGTNTSAMMIVAKTIAGRISLLASKTTVDFERRSSAGLAAFCLKRRNTFSTSMIASSTRLPTAIASPPSVITLIVSPSASRASKPAASESGSAVSVTSVVRTFRRKSARMTETMIAASRSASTTLRTARSMKSAWRKICRLICTPAGWVRSSASSKASTWSVIASVFVPGAFCSVITTAG